MGRELKRKEAKKNKKQINNSDIDFNTNINMMTLLKLVFFVILFLLVIYYLLAVFVTKEIDISNKNTTANGDTTENQTAISDKILASNIFNQKDDVYYVYFYDFNSNNEQDDLSNLISENLDEKVYKVDTGSGLNSKYVTEKEGNTKAKSLEELKVINNTLIKIDNDKITEYYEGKNYIMKGIKD